MSQDLIAYFDQRFSETSQQFRTLREDLDQRFSETSQQFQTLREDLDQRFSETTEQIQQQIHTLREEMKKGFEEADLRLRTEIRLTHVSIEGVRGEVRLVAEGVDSLNERFQRFQQEISRGLEPRVTRLENRVSALEADEE